MFCRKLKKQRNFYRKRNQQNIKAFDMLIYTIREILKRDIDPSYGSKEKEIRCLLEEAVSWVSKLDIYNISTFPISFNPIGPYRMLDDLEKPEWP